jgi:hypothetical protein
MNQMLSRTDMLNLIDITTRILRFGIEVCPFALARQIIGADITNTEDRAAIAGAFKFSLALWRDEIDATTTARTRTFIEALESTVH